MTLAVGVAIAGGWCGAPASAATLEVGVGKPFLRIEDANAKARPGDVVLVYPLPDDQPYARTAVCVAQRNVAFRAAGGPNHSRVRISGAGYDYSGAGRVPRAIFQFNRGADACLLEGFDLADAHNTSHNGAGVRINQANDVTVRNCALHHNDMGVMSNGDGSLDAGANQRIERCLIHHNGNQDEPGQNHNLYLGGASVTLFACEIHSSLTGHNLKSRAHLTVVTACYIHHSNNREFDLVDAKETALPGSDAVLAGNIIVKDPACPGNRGVIHFGQDGGNPHDGTLTLVNNTIVTPFVSPVVDLSAAGAHARLLNNIVGDGGSGQQRMSLVEARRAGADQRNASGTHNWLADGFAPLAPGFPRELNFAAHGAPPFADPQRGDFQLTKKDPQLVGQGLPWDQIAMPAAMPSGPSSGPSPGWEALAWEYQSPAAAHPRTDHGTTLGACGWPVRRANPLAPDPRHP